MIHACLPPLREETLALAFGGDPANAAEQPAALAAAAGLLAGGRAAGTWAA